MAFNKEQVQKENRSYHPADKKSAGMPQDKNLDKKGMPDQESKTGKMPGKSSSGSCGC